jgi:hypothetical protein
MRNLTNEIFTHPRGEKYQSSGHIEVAIHVRSFLSLIINFLPESMQKCFQLDHEEQKEGRERI